MSHEAVVVCTAKSIARLLQEEGTSSWRLDRNRALACEYVVCTRNAHADWVEGREDHRSAFLIGKIKDVVSSPDPGCEDRYLITFSEYSLVDFPEVWKKDRYPVKYTTLEELGIDPSTLVWNPMPQPGSPAAVSQPVAVSQPAASSSPAAPGLPVVSVTSSLTIADAKKGLALTYGVPFESIEITIRG